MEIYIILLKIPFYHYKIPLLQSKSNSYYSYPKKFILHKGLYHHHPYAVILRKIKGMRSFH